MIDEKRVGRLALAVKIQRRYRQPPAGGAMEVGDGIHVFWIEHKDLYEKIRNLLLEWADEVEHAG